jgi:N-acetyldiaminopimelate deacetylase
LRRELHQIPELGFEEFKTQQLILTYLQTLPKERIEIETWKTGILVKISGNNPSCSIGYRVDMDALPIKEDTSYSFQSKHEGIMHACGHDMHMAIGLGILTYFVEHPIDNDLLFLFQPAEEGPGGALPMLQTEAFQKWKPDMIFALHIAPEYSVGTIATRPGILLANASELFIQLTGKGGHAAYPHLANDMILASSQLISQLHTIVSRNINPLDAGVITIGELHAGTRQNIIAEKAIINGTIRSLSEESMRLMKTRIEEVVRGIEESYDCRATIDYGCQYCQVTNHHESTQSFMNWVQNHTPYTVKEAPISMGGEDFGYFLKEIPGFMFWLGVDTPYSLHHPKIEPSEGAINVAIDVMTNYIRQV